MFKHSVVDESVILDLPTLTTQFDVYAEAMAIFYDVEESEIIAYFDEIIATLTSLCVPSSGYCIVDFPHFNTRVANIMHRFFSSSPIMLLTLRKVANVENSLWVYLRNSRGPYRIEVTPAMQ